LQGWFWLQADAVVLVNLALEFGQALESHARFFILKDEL
jgi:hypothetical protein